MHNQLTLCCVFRRCLGILSKYFSFLEMNYVKDFLIMGLQVDINLNFFKHKFEKNGLLQLLALNFVNKC